MSYLGDKYNDPDYIASEAAYAVEMFLRRQRGTKRDYYCEACETTLTGLREMDRPPAECPSCKAPWDHLRRWTIRMEADPFGGAGQGATNE